MVKISTTKLSSKGQIVIPEEIRNRLGLEPGAQFVVLGEGDVVVLKAINPPGLSDFEGLITQAREQAKNAGLKPDDLASAAHGLGKSSAV